MKRVMLFVGIVFITISPLFADKSKAKLLVFVGQQISFEEIEDPCEYFKKRENVADSENNDNEERICVPFDSIFIAQYSISELVYGETSEETLSFTVSDHYGFPDFAHYKSALLFVFLDESGNYLSKYQAFPVFETTNDSWAVCGVPKRYKDKYDPKKDKGLKFRDNVIFGSTHVLNSEYVENDYPTDRYEIVDGIIKCRTPVGVKQMYEMVRYGVLKARGYE